MAEIKSHENMDEELEKLYDELDAEKASRRKKTQAETKMQKIMDEIEDSTQRSKRESNELLRFFCGLLLFAAGLYMIFQNLMVTSSWGSYGGGSFFHIGGYSLPNGTLMIPLLIGIALLFLCDRKLWGWLFIAVGISIVIAAVILSVSIQWRTTSAWVFLIMFGMTFAGGAMMLRELFRSR